jgi:hypothetical protein
MDRKLTPREDRQLDAIVEIYFPWFRQHPGRVAVEGTLIDGATWNARIPFPAALQIEEAGYDIRVVGNLDA